MKGKESGAKFVCFEGADKLTEGKLISLVGFCTRMNISVRDVWNQYSLELRHGRNKWYP